MQEVPLVWSVLCNLLNAFRGNVGKVYFTWSMTSVSWNLACYFCNSKRYFRHNWFSLLHRWCTSRWR